MTIQISEFISIAGNVVAFGFMMGVFAWGIGVMVGFGIKAFKTVAQG